ncbi:MipA/OmpV family protein [Pantoea sp. SIMBA_079]|uniref:MipA/OmpV family protein n=1 Tax=Pantoea TaxID=53335 RepID=UPI00080F39FA|nr:MipA/OmpV family protein [Pantoea eucrina]
MKNAIKSGVAIVLLTGSFLQAAQANDLSLGLTASWSSKLYQQVNENKNNLLFPNVDYEADRFWFHGLSTGYDLLHTPSDRIAVLAYYLPLSFRAGDSHSWQMRQLKDRRSTLMTGLSYSHQSDDLGKLETALSTDALGTSNGLHWSSTWSYPLQSGAFSIEPALGVNWNDRKFNRYYFGISSGESARSGLKEYSPGDSWTPFAELSLNYNLTANWDVYGGARYTFLPDEVKHSPMIAEDSLVTFWGGFSYSF